MGWEPVGERIEMFRRWHVKEGMPLETTWNPLATCWLSDDTPLNYGFRIPGLPAGNWNVLNPERDPNYGVRVYRDAEAGIRATVYTLQQGYYPEIREAFTELSISPADWDDVFLRDELTTYIGSRGYGVALVAEWEEILDMADPRVDDIVRVLQASGVQAWADSGNEPLRDAIAKIQNDVASIKQSVETLAQVAPLLTDYASIRATCMGINDLLNLQWRPLLNAALADKGVALP